MIVFRFILFTASMISSFNNFFRSFVKCVKNSAMWRHKYEWLSISFLGVFFPNSPLIPHFYDILWLILLNPLESFIIFKMYLLHLEAKLWTNLYLSVMGWGEEPVAPPPISCLSSASLISVPQCSGTSTLPSISFSIAISSIWTIFNGCWQFGSGMIFWEGGCSISLSLSLFIYLYLFLPLRIPLYLAYHF